MGTKPTAKKSATIARILKWKKCEINIITKKYTSIKIEKGSIQATQYALFVICTYHNSYIIICLKNHTHDSDYFSSQSWRYELVWKWKQETWFCW